jgi:hypothetical protein
MGILFTTLLFSKKPDLNRFIGTPYPLALIELHEQDRNAILVPLNKGEEYHPLPDHKGSVVILYDSETAAVLRLIQE